MSRCPRKVHLRRFIRFRSAPAGARGVVLAASHRRLPRADQPAVSDPRAPRADRGDRPTKPPTRRPSLIKPGYRWPGHRPAPVSCASGSISRGCATGARTRSPRIRGGRMGSSSITVKNVDEGKVSRYLVRRGVRGHRLPRRRRGRFHSARAAPGQAAVHQRRERNHADHRACCAISITRAESGTSWRSISHHTATSSRRGSPCPGGSARRVRLHEQLTRDNGRMGPHDLDRLCPDWTERSTYLSGPSDMLDGFTAHWEQHGDRDQARLHMERSSAEARLGMGQRARAE